MNVGNDGNRHNIVCDDDRFGVVDFHVVGFEDCQLFLHADVFCSRLFS